MTPKSTGLLLAPIVDIVLPATEEELDAVFDPRTRKLIGALHRRFWDRRRKMLADRAIGMVDIEPAYAEPTATGDFGEVVADLREHRSVWEERLTSFGAVRSELGDRPLHSSTPIVRVRGWNETEAGVLVDGRAVPGCIVDVAIAMSHAAPLLREGIEAMVLDVEQAGDRQEAKLWNDLIQLAEDRTGVERGTVPVGTVTMSERTHAAVA